MASIIKRTYKAIVNGKPVVRECDHWTIQYRDAAGKIRRVKGYSDKGATKQLAAQLEKNLARGEAGLIDPFKASKARALADHIKDFVSDLRTKGRASKYVINVEARMKILAAECGWSALSDIEPNSFMRWRDAESKRPPRWLKRETKKDRVAPKTLNEYLDTVRAFLNWCKQTNRFPVNALAEVSKVSGGAKRKRRALNDDEVSRLLGVAGDRAILYRVGLSTGLRRSELNALQWGDVRLNAIKPYIQLRAETTKARRDDRLSLPVSLAESLRTIKPTDGSEGDAVFPRGVSLFLWKKDLRSAKIAYVDAQGRQADFHGGTRKTLCTRLHRAGVPLASAMRIMRHTDARLTLVDYTDDETLGADDAAAALPEVLAGVLPVVNVAAEAG